MRESVEHIEDIDKLLTMHRNYHYTFNIQVGYIVIAKLY